MILRAKPYDITATDTPRILAVEDVHLLSPLTIEADLRLFYIGLLGFDEVRQTSELIQMVFRGYPRSGPQLIVSLTVDPPPQHPRRRVLIQVASLYGCAEALEDRGISFEWMQGWSFTDRRLATQDPAGNRVELVSYHPL